MIGATTGADSSGSAASIYLAQQLQGANSLNALNTLTSGSGTSGAGQTSSAISRPGQLLSNLQQLQTQNPAEFQQVVGQIASQLQTAAQQSQGPQSNFLSSLAAKFQGVANGNSLSSLQPQQAHAHHHHHAHQAYSQNSSADSSQGIAGLTQTGSSSSNGVDLQQLFASISSEVSTALAGQQPT